MKKIIKKEEDSKKRPWVAIHWLGGIGRIDTEKRIKKFCEENSYNQKHPIYHAVPLKGVSWVVCDKCGGKGHLMTPTNSHEK